MIEDNLRAPGVSELRDELHQLLLEYHRIPMNVDEIPRVAAEVEARMMTLIKAAERRGELKLPQRIVTAGELRQVVGRLPGWNEIPDHAVMMVVDHAVRVWFHLEVRSMETKLRPVAEWWYDGRKLRVPEDDTDLAVAWYRAKGGL